MRKRNCGFVSFVNREDAEDAKNAMHDQEIEGYRISIGWGRAVKKPPNLKLLPKPVVPVVVAAAVSAAPVSNPSGIPLPADRQNTKWDQTPVAKPKQAEMQETDTKIKIALPKDPVVTALINRLAHYVAKDGK